MKFWDWLTTLCCLQGTPAVGEGVIIATQASADLVLLLVSTSAEQHSLQLLQVSEQQSGQVWWDMLRRHQWPLHSLHSRHIHYDTVTATLCGMWSNANPSTFSKPYIFLCQHFVDNHRNVVNSCARVWVSALKMCMQLMCSYCIFSKTTYLFYCSVCLVCLYDF